MLLRHVACRRFAAAAALILAWAGVSNAAAEVLLELTFQSAPSGGQLTADQSSATNQLAVLGGTAVSPAPAGPAGTLAKISSGVLSVPRSSTTDTSGLQSVSSPAGSPRYDAFIGAENTLGTSTLLVVFRPHFNGPTPNGVVHQLFAHSQYGYGNSVFWTIHDNNQLFLSLRGTASRVNLSMAAPNWNSNTWYVLAASWAPGQQSRLYYRALTPESVGSFASSAANIDMASGQMLRPIYIGQASTSDGSPAGNSADGDFAYFLWNSDYTNSQAGFDALYNSLVPEPSIASILATGLIVLVPRRGTAATR